MRFARSIKKPAGAIVTWPRRLDRRGLPSEETENSLRSRVGLGQGGDTCLLQDLRLGEVSGFLGQIRIANTGFGCSEVAQLGLGQADGEVELVLSATDDGL